MRLHRLIHNSSNTRLILIFSGWSVDWHLFRRYKYPKGYDVSVVWDYSNLEYNIFNNLTEYDETIVLAWSFGVASFNLIYKYLPSRININCAIAVNGTTNPVDETKGIPCNIFSGTMSDLSHKTLQSFQRRICGSRARYNEISDDLQASQDDIESLKRQLAVFSPEATTTDQWTINENDLIWDRAFISLNDKIFPPENMIRAWEAYPVAITTNQSEHLPDFQNIINTVIRDKLLIGQRFGASQATYDKYAEVQTYTAQHLMKIWKSSSEIKNIVEVGSGSGILSKMIAEKYPVANVTWIDLAESIPQGCNGIFMQGDAEIIIKNLQENQYDAVVSANAVQWFHSPLRFLVNAAKLLKEEGQLIISTFGPGTFCELSCINNGASLPYLSVEEWQKYARAANLKISICEREVIKLEFENGIELAKHLKNTGVNALTKPYNTENYQNLRGLLNYGQCHLTFNPLYLVLQK